MKLLFDENLSLIHTCSHNRAIDVGFPEDLRDRQGSKIKELVETLS